MSKQADGIKSRNVGMTAAKAFRFGLMGMASATALAGCGAVYYPVSAPSERSLFIKDDERRPYDLQIVNLTIAAAQEANARWQYTPRGVPSYLQGNLDTGYAPVQLADADGAVNVRATTQSSSTLPGNPPRPYELGPGDTLVVVNVADVETGTVMASRDPELQNRYRISQEGDIFVPEIGLIDVAGKTLSTVRREIQSRMSEVYVAPIAVVNVVDFASQSYTITGASIQPSVQYVSMEQTSLREAVIGAGASGVIYDDATVVLVRNGREYAVPYRNVLYNGLGSDTTMLDGDLIRIEDADGSRAKTATLDSTVQNAQIDRQRLTLQQSQIDLQRTQGTIAEQQLVIQREQNQRADRELQVQLERLQLERERLEQTARAEERALQELNVLLGKEQREATLLDIQRQQEARGQALLDLQRQQEARGQALLDIQRQQEAREQTLLNLQQSRAAREQTELDLQRTRNEREQAQLDLQRANAARQDAELDLARARKAQEDARILREQAQLDLQRADQSLRSQADARSSQELEISKLTTRDRLGGVERDYVFVAGEVGQTNRMAMPFSGELSLADALFEAEGLDPTTGNPRGIHVVRTDYIEAGRPKVYVFKLDARNLANLSASTVFKMRPNDILYVTPQPVSNWNRALSQMLGGTNALLGSATNLAR